MPDVRIESNGTRIGTDVVLAHSGAKLLNVYSVRVSLYSTDGEYGGTITVGTHPPRKGNGFGGLETFNLPIRLLTMTCSVDDPDNRLKTKETP